MPAWLALTIAGAISLEPLGVRHSALIFRSIRFSTICICFSTSTSRSAACTNKFRPALCADSRAPRSISMKNGLLSVFITRATVGPEPVCFSFRWQPITPPISSKNIRTGKTRRDFISEGSSGGLFSEGQVQEYCDNDHRADNRLLDVGRDVQKIQAIAQHSHNQGANERASHFTF